MATQSCLAEEQKQPQEAPESPRSLPLPPSSPRARPSSRRQAPRASPGSRASQPGPHLRSQALPSAPGPALRSRTTLRSPAVRLPLSARDPARGRHTAGRARFDVSNQASGSGIVLLSHPPLPGPGRCRHRSRSRCPGRRSQASRSSSALQCSAVEPGSATHSSASGPSPALQPLSDPVSPASSSSSTTTAGFVSKSRPSGRRSTPGSCPSPPGPADQSSSSSPDAEAPSLPSQQRWHAVRMRASSPSPPEL
uniref:Uncharacterized protein n=1 Tax=Molossus molossus TaxID=27622 RepID=A0A7J8J6H3_MOLMO|nr:hypothetical protein HJG59_009668 [Molossus molossus]KAF6492471.1 hypothetical protein HJG59_009668 [Molossus molossus]